MHARSGGHCKSQRGTPGTHDLGGLMPKLLKTLLLKVFQSTSTILKLLSTRYPTSVNLARAKQAVKELAEDKNQLTDVAWIGALKQALEHASPQPDYQAQLDYLRPAVDLQITKASSLRTYFGLIITASVFLFSQVGDATTKERLGWAIFFALVGALLTLVTSVTCWPTEKQADGPASELNWLAGMLALRGDLANLAVLGAFVATGFCGFGLIRAWEEQPTHQKPPAAGNALPSALPGKLGSSTPDPTKKLESPEKK